MATRATIERIARQIDRLAAKHEATTYVPVYDGESEGEALRHLDVCSPVASPSPELVTAIDGRTVSATEWVCSIGSAPRMCPG